MSYANRRRGNESLCATCGPVTTPPQEDDCSAIKTQLEQAQANKALAETKLSETEAKLTEVETKLAECEASKCPEAKVVSLGGETVFSGTSCETMTSIGGDAVVPNQP